MAKVLDNPTIITILYKQKKSMSCPLAMDKNRQIFSQGIGD